MSSVTDTDILILGASFAGIEVVHQLVRFAEGRPPAITVVDRSPVLPYLPLVQERLCGRLDLPRSQLDTATYVGSIPGARFVQGEVVGLDPEAKAVRLASGAVLRARFVVVALGSVSRPPPHLDGAQHLVPYKDAGEFEEAAARLDRQARRAPASIVVIGGGISGVELAGELASLSARRPDGWHAPQVALASASDRLLPGMAPRLGAKVEAALRRQGVDLRLGTRVLAAHPLGEDDPMRSERPHATRLLEQGPGGAEPTSVSADLVFWAAGVQPAPILATLGLPRDSAGWLTVGPTLQCFPEAKPERPDLFACGDAVTVVGGKGSWNTMRRAIECIWQAKVVARNVLTLAKEPSGYPNGVPPLHPHRLRPDFFYGVSVGRRSLVAYRGLSLDLPGINHSFRRWLMRRYFERYAPLGGRLVEAPGSGR